MLYGLGLRLRFFYLCVNPALRWIGIAVGALGTVTLVQQECLPHPYADYRIFDVLPKWSWQAWVIVILLILLVSALEALYQYAGQESTIPRPRLYTYRGEEYKAPHIRRGWTTRYALPSVIVIGLLMYYLSPHLRLSLLSRMQSPAELPSANPTQSFYPTPLTLRQMFDTDFNVSSVTEDVTFTLTNKRTLHFSARLFFDFDANSQFIAFYIPFGSDAYTTCSLLPSKLPDIITSVERRLKIAEKIPGETAATWSHQMKFSGRVFVYYEDDLSLKQLSELEDRFEHSGESVEFRGQDYLVLHWNEKRQILKKFCPPGYELIAEMCVKK